MSDTEIVEEQDILVHVDFDFRIDDEYFDDLKQFKIIGIETESPILQVGDQVFKGCWKDTIGSHIFLEEDEEAEECGDVFSENNYSNLKYLCKTDKLLKMQRVFISKNEEDARSENEAIDVKQESEATVVKQEIEGTDEKTSNDDDEMDTDKSPSP